MPTLEEILRRKYPHPDDGKYARVGISDDYYTGPDFEDVEKYPGAAQYAERLFEVPVEWLDRWNRVRDAYFAVQQELERILRLPPGQDRIEETPSS